MNPKFSFAYHLAKKITTGCFSMTIIDLLTQSGKYFRQVYQGVPRDFKVHLPQLNLTQEPAHTWTVLCILVLIIVLCYRQFYNFK